MDKRIFLRVLGLLTVKAPSIQRISNTSAPSFTHRHHSCFTKYLINRIFDFSNTLGDIVMPTKSRALFVCVALRHTPHEIHERIKMFALVKNKRET